LLMTISLIVAVPMLTEPRIAAPSVLNDKPKSWLPFARLMPFRPLVIAVANQGLGPHLLQAARHYRLRV
jgi:hypothetical protein